MHISGIANPTGLPTQGLSAAKLTDQAVARTYISVRRFQRMASKTNCHANSIARSIERHAVVTMTGIVSEKSQLSPNNYSSFNRLVRVTAW